MDGEQAIDDRPQRVLVVHQPEHLDSEICADRSRNSIPTSLRIGPSAAGLPLLPEYRYQRGTECYQRASHCPWWRMPWARRCH
jgi:hypothetical protein